MYETHSTTRNMFADWQMPPA